MLWGINQTFKLLHSRPWITVGEIGGVMTSPVYPSLNGMHLVKQVVCLVASLAAFLATDVTVMFHLSSNRHNRNMKLLTKFERLITYFNSDDFCLVIDFRRIDGG